MNCSVVFFAAGGSVILTCQIIVADATSASVDPAVREQWPDAAAAAVAITSADPATDHIYEAKP